MNAGQIPIPVSWFARPSTAFQWGLYGTGTPWFNPLLSARSLCKFALIRRKRGVTHGVITRAFRFPSRREIGVASTSERKQIMTTSTHSTSAPPTHRLYVVTNSGTSASWREIGAAWPNKDGMGYSLNCAAIPLQGRIVMRAITEKPASKGGQQ